MKLWEKDFEINHEIEQFTVGRDREMDLYLARYDVLGSMAHITMLESIGLLTAEELDLLLKELRSIYDQAEKGDFVIEEGVEDVHSQCMENGISFYYHQTGARLRKDGKLYNIPRKLQHIQAHKAGLDEP